MSELQSLIRAKEAIWLIGAFFDRNYEIFSYAIPMIGFAIGLLVNGVMKGYTNLESSRLFQTIEENKIIGGFSISCYAQMVSAIYFTIGVQYSFATWHEIRDGAMQIKAKRIDIIARIYFIFAFLLPAAVLSAYLQREGLPNNAVTVAAVVNFIMDYQFFVIVCTAASVIMHPTEWLARPLFIIPLEIGVGISCLLEQLYSIHDGNDAVTNTLDSARTVFQIPFYVLTLISILTVGMYCRLLFNGVAVPGRCIDFVYLITLLFLWYAISRGLGFKSLRLYPRDVDFDAWVFYRFFGGSIFFLMWQMRSTHVIMRRAELQEKLKIQAERREETVRSAAILKERQMAIRILHSMVPPKVANDLSKGVEVMPEMFAFTVVFFSDIQGFTKFASMKSPLEVFAMLNRLFRVMDFCVSLFPKQLYKIETIGDAYMVVAGILDDDDDDEDEDEEDAATDNTQPSRMHDLANATCQFALLVREASQLVPFDEVSFVKLRIGIHSGPIVTGLSGSIVPRYSCYGDTVNVASRMESTGETCKVHVSSGFATLIMATPWAFLYTFEKRIPIDVKGKGLMQTYFVEIDVTAFRKLHKRSLTRIETIIKSYRDDRYVFADNGSILMVPPQQSERKFASFAFSEGSATGSKTSIHSNQSKDTFRILLDDEAGMSWSAGMLAAASKSGMSLMGNWSGSNVIALMNNWSSSNSSSTIGTFPIEHSLKKSDEGHRSDESAANEIHDELHSILSLNDGDLRVLLNDPVYRRQKSSHRSFDELTACDFDVLLIGQHDSEGISSAILTLIEGIVGPLADIIADPLSLGRLVRRAGMHYRIIPYHNYHHSFCVVQQTAFMILLFDLKSQLTPKELFVVLLVALLHDLDHPGHSNSFEVATKSNLALLYNDQAVLENHHLALSFSIMVNKTYNVFEGWDPASSTQARRIMIAAILATDMECHGGLQADLLARAAKPQPFDLSLESEKIALTKIILHTADISNPVRPFATSSRISMQAIQEFNQQAIGEAAAGIPVTASMVTPTHESKCLSEIGFLEFIARPYFQALVGCFPSSAAKFDFVSVIDTNVDRWKDQMKCTELVLSSS